jgi:hypothetical protein
MKDAAFHERIGRTLLHRSFTGAGETGALPSSHIVLPLPFIHPVQGLLLHLLLHPVLHGLLLQYLFLHLMLLHLLLGHLLLHLQLLLLQALLHHELGAASVLRARNGGICHGCRYEGCCDDVFHFLAPLC